MTAVGVSHFSITVLVLRKSHGKKVLTLSCEPATVLHFESAPVQLPVQPAGVKIPGWNPTSMPPVAAVSTVRKAISIVDDDHMHSVSTVPLPRRMLEVVASNSSEQLTRPVKPP